MESPWGTSRVVDAAAQRWQEGEAAVAVAAAADCDYHYDYDDAVAAAAADDLPSNVFTGFV